MNKKRAFLSILDLSTCANRSNFKGREPNLAVRPLAPFKGKRTYRELSDGGFAAGVIENTLDCTS